MAGCRLTDGEGDFKESATEINRRSRKASVRMERRSKSPPHPRQRGWQCKPRPVQDCEENRLSAVPPVSLERIGNDASRQITVPDRIRLTDYLAFLINMLPYRRGLFGSKNLR